MVSVTALWLPILLAAIIVFVASAVVHMALPWHSKDFRKLANEDQALDAMRNLNLSPGEYTAPMAASTAEMNTDEYKAKIERGPQVILTVLQPGSGMGKQLAAWFVFLLVVSGFTGFAAGTVIGPGASYMFVFHTTMLIAFACFAFALWPQWIWYARSLGNTIRSTIDGAVYALLVAGCFGWLWP